MVMIMLSMMSNGMLENRTVRWMVYPELNNPLYHGSTVEVNHIELSFSAIGKDFGRGFYTTTTRDQVFFGTKKAVSCLHFEEAFEIGIN
jgi:hypothetical protein